MRFIYGGIALALWVGILSEIPQMISNDAITISCAIIAAGAMAAGK